MTQIQTPVKPSLQQGPQGIGASSLGGVYAPLEQQDIINGDGFQGPITLLSGTTDAINPRVSGNYIIKTGSADAITLGLPRAGFEDNLSICIFSDTLFAHTVTLPTTGFAPGSATVKTIATFPAFRGAGIVLRGFNGTWQVVGNTGPVIFT